MINKESYIHIRRNSEMKNLFFVIIILLINISQSEGQNNINDAMSFSIDHFAINVKNLDESVNWYQKVFSLKEIYDGTEKDNIRWFRLGIAQELHIIEVPDLQLQIPKGVHIALTTKYLDQFIAHLDDLKIVYYDWPGKAMSKSTRPDGIQQVYIMDPDGYWVEINNGKIRESHD